MWAKFKMVVRLGWLGLTNLPSLPRFILEEHRRSKPRDVEKGKSMNLGND